MTEPRWLTAEVVISVNKALVEETAKPHGLRDMGLLEGALGRPINLFHYSAERDAARLATTLLFALAANHPFVQGNKRTAFVAALMFLESNGYGLVVPDSELLAKQIVFVIEGRMTEDEFLLFLEPYIVPHAPD